MFYQLLNVQFALVFIQAVPQKVSERIIRLTQSNKVLYLVFEGSVEVDAKAWSTKPSNSYEENNAGTFFIGFEFTIPAGETREINVKMLPAGDPLLNGLDLNSTGQQLNVDFETFETGSLSSGFVSWRMNPASDGTMKAVVGEVVANPFKSGINTSDKVLMIKRQDDSGYITSSNAGTVTYRGAQAYGYDLRVNANSVVEFKYYKDAPGKTGIRIYDGNGSNFLLADFTDPYESTYGYSTAKWRTAQFEVGKLNLSNFNYTASGYLLISPERTGSEIFQEKALTIYVDDVKMLPLTTHIAEKSGRDIGFTAYYDHSSNRIAVMNLQEKTRLVRLYDMTGRKINEVEVYGSVALLDTRGSKVSVYIVQAITTDGVGDSVKVKVVR